MACIAATDDYAASTTGTGDEDRSLSGESLPEWWSCEQVESESPSNAPPFWDTDGDDDDPGPKPSDLFGRYTWRIGKFSKEKKREMKSEPFEAGGYKWYILVYPQGCDVSNHLSLFLCVANYDKHLPGWSHFAQFTIAVGNIDPKKVKYSDTLHRFWKKEHDWGWKKFMELSKIQDGFLVDDVLEIIAQVQVIREKVDRPFRCLDRPYRRELLRVYMSNIEQIYQRFVEERRSKLSKLIEDKMRWSSFRAFWLAIDPSTKHRMCREKTDAILKIMVKHFFVEKEVTSTLVMDSLYTGLKALEYQSKSNKGRTKVVDLEEPSAPMVLVNMDMFVLGGDVIALLERATLEPFPCQPLSPKDDKCSQRHMKDGTCGEINKISIDHEERRLTELGQKILETVVLSHIFSGIEVAYQETVALKRQEELIREEEAAGLLKNEMKGKRGGGAAEKEKRAKKKQAKQKKNNRKVKEKARDEKSYAKIQERLQDENAIDDGDILPSKQAEQVTTEVDALEEGASDVSDNLDGLVVVHQPDSGDKNSKPMNGVNDVASEIKNAQRGKKISTCLVESAAVNSMHGNGNSSPDSKNQMSPNRGKNQCNKSISIISLIQEGDGLPSSVAAGSDRNTSGCGTAPKFDQETVLLTLKDKIWRLEQCLHEKEIEGRKLLKAHFEVTGSKTRTAGSSSSSSSLEEPPDFLNCPEHSSETTCVDIKSSAPPNKDASVATCMSNEGASGMPISTMNTEVVSSTSTSAKKVESVLDKDLIKSSTSQVDRAAPNPSKSPPVDKAAPLSSRSLLVDRAAPVPSKSPPVDKAAPVPSKSLHIDKAMPVNSRSPYVDKVALPLGLPQTSSTSCSESQEQISLAKVTTTFVSQVVVTTSRPSSAPVFPAPRLTGPGGPPVHISSPLLSCSLSEARRSSYHSSYSVSNVPQIYSNAIIGRPSLGTTSASFAYQSTSLAQGIALPQPSSTYTSTTSVTVPSVGRNDQLSGRQGFKFGPGKSVALDSWQPWKGNGDANKHLWRDDCPFQRTTNSDVYQQPRKDDSSQQANSSETEKLGRFGGLQPRQFQTGIPASSVLQLPQGPAVAEEFPHLDIINDLLEEEQSNNSMPGSLHHDYNTFGLPFSLRGLAGSEMTSAGSSGQFNLTELYYDEGFSRPYDTSALHGLRGQQFSTSDAYSNGRSDLIASKPWLYGPPNQSLNLGVNTNGFSHQMGGYTNLASGANGGSLYRHTNGRW